MTRLDVLENAKRRLRRLYAGMSSPESEACETPRELELLDVMISELKEELAEIEEITEAIVKDPWKLGEMDKRMTRCTDELDEITEILWQEED